MILLRMGLDRNLANCCQWQLVLSFTLGYGKERKGTSRYHSETVRSRPARVGRAPEVSEQN